MSETQPVKMCPFLGAGMTATEGGGATDPPIEPGFRRSLVGEVVCLREECELWCAGDGGGCALRFLTGALGNVANEVRQLHELILMAPWKE